MIPLLQPLFRGDWSAYAETLVCTPSPPAGAVPVADLIARPGLLHDVMARQARYRRVQGADLRAVASAWTMDYLWALLPGAVAAASVLQHRFPLAPEHLAVALDDLGLPRAFYLCDEGKALPGSDTMTRFGPLLHQHLSPLFVTLSAQTRVPRKILWGSAARYIEGILEQARAQIGPMPGLLADHDLLLDQPRWPDGERNPMHARCGNMNQAAPHTLHRQCCLYYLLPDEDYCGACPLGQAHVQA
ncbi:siderophore-iron reductase FhuF [Chitiniphilus eburneus]|uniref:Siderophore-iron reductase FhuF n=1 Tax=Chitiniphilus eburneus TaxID=2571148 RepID=A0A4U0PAP0_9NEIS|nr:siderophore-iron reductase FhuF [Chitiniphilus eburneus]TJZ64737.1 siderophore-iron reductase FhuF [Chitiniphilus eburneus]